MATMIVPATPSLARAAGWPGYPSRPAVCTAESPASTRGLHRALLGGGPDLFGVGAGGRVGGGALHDENGVVQGDPEQVVEVVRHAPGRLPRLCSRSDWRSRLPGACCSALACLRPVRSHRHAVNTGGPGGATLVMESSTGKLAAVGAHRGQLQMLPQHGPSPVAR